MKNIIKLFFLIFIIIPAGCHFSADESVVISDIQLEKIHIKRYGRDLFNIDPDKVGQGLSVLAKEYSFFLGDNYMDTLSIIQIRDYISDPFLYEIAAYSKSIYPNLEDVETQLTGALKYYLHYFPDGQVPDYYSYISGIDFEHPVQYLDTVMIIAIDDYLGSEFIPYKRLRIPKYQSRRMQKAYMVPDCMREVARVKHLPAYAGEKLIDHMIHGGKILYFLDKVLPSTADSLKIGFTGKQLEWCDENEVNLWAFLVENELLYTADFQKINKLIHDGPFTSFFDQESPARTGIWVGWQIVKSYMDRSNISLQELMEEKDAVDILSQSGYKP